MPSKQEIDNALFGAWRLMLFDAGGMNWFNLTIEGFWRSFFAVLPVAPFFALLVYLDDLSHDGPDAVERGIITTMLVYGIGWVLVPLVMMPVTKLLGLTRGFIPMMVAYNWTTVPQIIIQSLIALPGGLGLISFEMSGILLFTGVVYILCFEWFVIRTALQTTGMTAVAIVMLLETLGILVNLMAYTS